MPKWSVVDDGTAEAYLHIENAVACDVMRVTPEELDCLKKTCLSKGALYVQRRPSAKELPKNEKISALSQRKLCEQMLQERFVDPRLCRYWLVQYKLFRKQSCSSGFRTTSVVVRNTEYSSCSYPKVSLQAVGMYPVDYSQEAKILLM